MTKRRKRETCRALPRGAYPVPEGGYMVESVSQPNRKRQRLRIIAHHRAQPDVAAIARAVLLIAKEKTKKID